MLYVVYRRKPIENHLDSFDSVKPLKSRRISWAISGSPRFWLIGWDLDRSRETSSPAPHLWPNMPNPPLKKPVGCFKSPIFLVIPYIYISILLIVTAFSSWNPDVSMYLCGVWCDLMWCAALLWHSVYCMLCAVVCCCVILCYVVSCMSYVSVCLYVSICIDGWWWMHGQM